MRTFLNILLLSAVGFLGVVAANIYYAHAPAQPAVPAQHPSGFTYLPEVPKPLSAVLVRLDDGRVIVVTIMTNGTHVEAYATAELIDHLKTLITEEHSVTIDPRGRAKDQVPQVFNWHHAKARGVCANMNWLDDRNYNLYRSIQCVDI